MLDVIETLIADALRAALPSGTVVNAGPLAPSSSADASVAVAATGLSVPLASSADAVRDRREPPHPSRRYDLGPHPGTQVALGLPQTASGELVEVQCPPGRVLSSDAYVIDGRTLHLLVESDGAVIILLRGAPAAGYRETQQCRLQLSLVVTAAQPDRASRLFAAALAAALAAVADIDVIDLHRRDDGRFAVRLLRPVAQLQSMTQAAEENAGKSWHRRQVELVLRGDLELLLATTEVRQPAGIIREVDLDGLHVRGGE